MSNLYNLLQKIKEHPVLYLRQPSIEHLESFILGYSSNESISNEPDCLYGFTEYVSKKYDIYAPSHSWVDIIRFFSYTDQQAFYEFYKIFDEFHKLSKEEREEITKDLEKSVKNLTIYKINV